MTEVLKSGLDDGSKDIALRPVDVSIPSDIQVIKLQESGDVILKLDGQAIQVSSKILSVASPYFRGLFSPRFSEGQALKDRYGNNFSSSLA